MTEYHLRHRQALDQTSRKSISIWRIAETPILSIEPTTLTGVTMKMEILSQITKSSKPFIMKHSPLTEAVS